MKEPIPVRVYSTAMLPVGLVDDIEFLSWNRNWYEPDTWTLNINRYKTNADLFVLGGFIGFTGKAGEYIGIIETKELPLEQTGKISETYTISGKGVEGIFYNRIAFYGTAAGTGYDIQANVKTETAMRHYVYYNCIATGVTARNMAGITLAGADGLKGDTVYYEARFQFISQILEELCRTSELSYDLTWTGTGKNFVFNVVAGTDVSDTVFLSPEFDNIEMFQYMDSVADMKNLMYLGGAGSANTRTMAVAYDSSEPTGWDRREYYSDASDCADSNQLALRGNQLLQEYGETLTLEVNYYPSATFIYGTDFDLGDVITVIYPGIAIVVSRIISVTEEVSTEYGEKTMISIGRDYPDLKGLFKVVTRSIAPGARK
jgi:hypothetical protein